MWFLDMRTLGQGGPLGTVKLSDGTNFRDTPGGHLALQNEIAGRDVLFATHGFANNRSQGTGKLTEFDRHMQMRPTPVVIGVLWPGDSLIHLGIDYIWELGEADGSGRRLAEYIDANFGDATSISFASHSLGVRVMLQAIRNLRSRRVRQLFLMAAAIEDTSLSAEFADAAGKIDRVSILFSENDKVLKSLYPAGNWLGRLLDRSTPNIKTALGRSGARAPMPAMVTGNLHIPDAFDYGHGDYLSEHSVAGDFIMPMLAPNATDLVPVGPNPPVTGADTSWKACWSAAMISDLWR